MNVEEFLADCLREPDVRVALSRIAVALEKIGVTLESAERVLIDLKDKDG